MEPEKTRRPGGRSARVRTAVHQAVTELAAERGYGNFTVGEVAARAGVADTSIYRRWGTLEALSADAAIGWLTEHSPIPDTGSLSTDLRGFAAKVAADVSGPGGLGVLRLAMALTNAGETGQQARNQFLMARFEQLRTMVDRAIARGERAPDPMDIVDHILAPIYVRTLFGMGPLEPGYTNGLADRLVDQSG
ncbi:TetR/AcrR family transcriptional regulator [Nocardia sp. NPDC058058]|uniref:TetR/AcrR family transcriptional regulator n=1 Tax=Nocardia sp. NPDC058058 TaxID=3346317 RepID=UPI0036DC2865